MYFKKWIPSCLAVSILACVFATHETLPDRDAADALAAAAVRAKDEVPDRVGPWVARDVEPQQAAVKLLRPNILFQRVYTNLETGEHVTVLVVHTRDVRDMIGHFPPVCYPGQGWTLVSSTKTPIRFGGHEWTGLDYVFRSAREGVSTNLLVRNFMLLPRVGVGLDMNDVMQASRSVARRFFGAGQVQIVFDDSMPAERREAVSELMLKTYEPLLSAVIGMDRRTDAGVPPHQGVTGGKAR